MQTKDVETLNSHERLLQTLSAILIELQALQTQASTNAASPAQTLQSVHNGLTVVAQMTREALAIVRSVTDEDMPAELQGSTLAEALTRLIEETAEKLGLSSRVSFSGVDDQGRPKDQGVSPAAERILYLIAREAFYEVAHHPGARRLRLALNYGRDELYMSIEDDGLNQSFPNVSGEVPPIDPGADMPAPPFAAVPSTSIDNGQTTLPIINALRQRIVHLGGSLTIEPIGERGTRVLARLPYGTDAHAAEEILSSPAVPAEDLVPTLSSPTAIEGIRILIVDSLAVTRAGLHHLLESYPDLHIIGEAADGVQAVSETLELGPQVVLMDAQLPEGQSLEALRQIKQLNLNTKVLLLATQEREEYLYETLRAGADGYVLKDIASEELAQAVRVVARGDVLIQPQIAGKLLSRFGRQANATRYDTLTARELEVLHLLARGLRNKEIAARLFVSERTVNFHLANIYQKLNVSGRTEALSKALEQGLIKP
jgi:DNA-binding NarL/FixJ family response regulator